MQINLFGPYPLNFFSNQPWFDFAFNGGLTIVSQGASFLTVRDEMTVALTTFQGSGINVNLQTGAATGTVTGWVTRDIVESTVVTVVEGISWRLADMLAAFDALEAGNDAPLLALLSRQSITVDASDATGAMIAFAPDGITSAIKVIGSAFGDEFRGSNGNDTIWSGAGDDYIETGLGNNEVWAGLGNDTMLGGSGNNTLGGGAGDDVIDGFDGTNQLWGGDGRDVLTSGQNGDIAGGGWGDDTVDGGDGNDTLMGGLGNDSVSGSFGRDAMYLGIGNDRGYGGDGNDTIFSGAGFDQLWGGGGADRFEFYRGYGFNRLEDFSEADGDVIALGRGMWTGTHGALTAAQVVSTFGRVTAAGDAVLDFTAAGTTVVVVGAGTLTGLEDSLLII